MHRFDRPTVLVTKTDLTYTVTLQTFFTLPSDNRQEAVVSQPLIAAAVSGDGARRASEWKSRWRAGRGPGRRRWRAGPRPRHHGGEQEGLRLYSRGSVREPSSLILGRLGWTTHIRGRRGASGAVRLRALLHRPFLSPERRCLDAKLYPSRLHCVMLH